MFIIFTLHDEEQGYNNVYIIIEANSKRFTVHY